MYSHIQGALAGVFEPLHTALSSGRKTLGNQAIISFFFIFLFIFLYHSGLSHLEIMSRLRLADLLLDWFIFMLHSNFYRLFP